MTKVAIYARYSSDNQREASIEGQFRLCREYAKRQGWQLVESYSDQAHLRGQPAAAGHPDAPRGRAVQAVQRHPGGVARSD